ncbi:MAG: DUF362 domain-containing protein [Brevinematia bacterium]
MEKVKVSLVKCDGYDIEKVYNAVKTSLDLIGGIDRLKAKGRRVLLKPNILCGKEPDFAVTTHPVIFEAAVRIFLENGFDVLAGDSPGLENIFSAARKCGLLEVAEKYNVPFIEFKNEVKVSNPSGRIMKSLSISKEIINCDIIVSLPKLKTHGQMYYTGALKNLFGCISGIKKAHFHFRFPDREKFADLIVDLNLLLKPQLGIMDGIVAMEGNGPQNGKPKKLGIVASSFDIAALDYVCAELIGYNYKDIPIIRSAMERKNYFVSDPIDIEVVGEKLSEVRDIHFEKIRIPHSVHFLERRLPEKLRKFLDNLITPFPFFSRKKCIRCGKCIEICPAKALSFVESQKDKFVSVDYKKCIKCYCCDEICPVSAIKLKIRLFSFL